jgi:serine-type D-Ala-D-Ala carboxypeptidase/endopeptidase
MTDPWDRRVASAAGYLVKKGHVDPVVAVDCADGRFTAGDIQQRWEIGSITKVLTALLLAQLARRGVVSLGDPITRFLPAGTALAPGLERVTLEHLASHRSGLPRLPPGLGGGLAMLRRAPADPYAGFDADRLVASLAEAQLKGTPGDTGVRYSNYGAGLLGYLLGLARGAGYESALTGEVLGPLDMASSTFGDESLRAGRHRGKEVGPWHLAALAGAGGLRSPAADLLTFAAAVASADSPLAAAIAETLRPRGSMGPAKIGLGWFMLGDGALLMHDGGTAGARTEIRVERHSRTAVVILGDGRGGTARAAGMLLDPRRR